MRMVIEDRPGRYSRRCGEQFPNDAEYATAFHGHDPHIPKPFDWREAVRWTVAVLLLLYLAWALMHGQLVPAR